MFKTFFVVVCVASALFPLLSGNGQAAEVKTHDFVWPTSFEGQTLKQLKLTAREIKFTQHFPGEIRRFSCGKQEILIRWITRANRKVHPSSDCFKGFGHLITPQDLHEDSNKNLWGSFIASKDNQSLTVREIIYDAQGQSYSDVSSWYWNCILGKSQGPWCAYTVASRPSTK